MVLLHRNKMQLATHILRIGPTTSHYTHGRYYKVKAKPYTVELKNDSRYIVSISARPTLWELYRVLKVLDLRSVYG